MNTPDILNLPTLTVLAVQETEHDYHVQAETAQPPISCTKCHSPHIVGFGKRAQFYNDLPMHGKRVGITVTRKRYRCKDCGVTFYEPLTAIHDSHHATVRLVKHIERESMRRTFASLAEETGIDEKTIRSIFKRYADSLDSTIRFEVPRWMGIDEIHIIKKPRCLITNVEENTLVNMLPNREKKAVVAYLKEIGNKKAIRYVAMDMWRPYKDAVKTVLPDAQVVVDKCHVTRMANQALETHRKALRRTLNSRQRVKLMRDRFILLKRPHDITTDEKALMGPWFEAFPTLGQAYGLKESFMGIWENAGNRAQAEDAYDQWKKNITPETEAAFKPLLAAFENWHDEIFAYFEHPVTNAYTESLNGLIRVANRMGRGYSFEALRAKLLYMEGTHKIVKPVHRNVKRPPGMENVSTFMSGSMNLSVPEEKPRNYGASIPALVKKLETE